MNTELNDTVIYVVHALKGYEYHEKRVQKLFADNDLDFEFVCDGDPTLTNRELLKKYFSETFIDKASVGGMSCTLNHMFAYERLIKSGKKYAIVFENDPFFLMDFTKGLVKIYNEIVQLNEGFIISLENTTLTFPSFFQTTKNKVLYKASAGRMAGAYLIDRIAAQRAIEDLQTTKCGHIIDWWHNQLINRKIVDMYWVHPPLVEQGSHNGMMNASLSAKPASGYRRLAWLVQKYYKMYVRRLFKQRRIIVY
jgi:glycosyl transferase, family 25